MASEGAGEWGGVGVRRALIRISGVGGRGLVVKRDERSGLVVGQVAGE